MRKYLLSAVAMAALSTPALARDGTPYVGIEAGVMMSDEAFYDVDFDGDDYPSGLNFDYELGFDADLIGGMDFGMFRIEGELGYKRMGLENIAIRGPLLGAIEAYTGEDLSEEDFDVTERVTVLSGMVNALLDFGGDTGIGAYIGAGAGRARTKLFGDNDGTWAWQGLAGIRFPVSDQMDLGLKYRYFNSGKLNFSESYDDGDGGLFALGVEGRVKTHSLLASLVYNFGAPPAPPPVVEAAPPPPPPPPATQTCPDGSVILATDVCPAPPPPPPPASPGERG